jgi:hypothetical protein
MFSKTELESSTSLSHVVFLTGVTLYLANTTFDIYLDLFCIKVVVLKCYLKIDILFFDRCLLTYQ